MSRYEVTLPITGYAIVEVEAEDEGSAIEAALNSEHLTLDAIEVWSGVKRIVQGNVFCGEVNEASAEIVDED